MNLPPFPEYQKRPGLNAFIQHKLLNFAKSLQPKSLMSFSCSLFKDNSWKENRKVIHQFLFNIKCLFQHFDVSIIEESTH